MDNIFGICSNVTVDAEGKKSYTRETVDSVIKE